MGFGDGSDQVLLGLDDGSDRCGSDIVCHLEKKDIESCSMPHEGTVLPKHPSEASV